MFDDTQWEDFKRKQIDFLKVKKKKLKNKIFIKIENLLHS